MNLRQQFAAGRDADGPGGVGAQELRREPGVVGWGDPDVEAGRRAGCAAIPAGRQRSGEPLSPIAAGVDRGDNKQDRQDGAQTPWVMTRQPSGRPADAQTAYHCHDTTSMRLPQAGRTAAERPARTIGEGGQRPVIEAALDLDAPAGGGRIGPRQPSRTPHRRATERDGKSGQNRHMLRAGEPAEQIEQREDREHAENE